MQTQGDEGSQDPEASSTAAGCVRLDNQLLALFVMLGVIGTITFTLYDIRCVLKVSDAVQ